MRNIYKIIITIGAFFAIDYMCGEFFLKGLNKNFGLNQESEIFIVGHSHMMMGVDRTELERATGAKVSKYTRTGVSLPERYLMTGQYLRSGYSDKLKAAIIGVDCFTFSEGGISDNCYTLFYPFYEDKGVNEYLKNNATFLEYWQHSIFHLSRYSDDLINSSIRGWRDDDRNYKTSTINLDDFERQKSKWKSKISFKKELQDLLDKMINELTEKHIKVYLVNTPTLDAINHAYPDNYARMMTYYRKLAEENENVEFIDFSKYESDYSIFFDPLHLNVKGQKLVTDSLATLLNNYFEQ